LELHIDEQKTVQEWCTNHSGDCVDCDSVFIAVFVSLFGTPVTVVTTNRQIVPYGVGPYVEQTTAEIFVGFQAGSRHYCSFEKIETQVEFDEVVAKESDAHAGMEVEATVMKAKAVAGGLWEDEQIEEQAESDVAATRLVDETLQLQSVEMSISYASFVEAPEEQMEEDDGIRTVGCVANPNEQKALASLPLNTGAQVRKPNAATYLTVETTQVLAVVQEGWRQPRTAVKEVTLLDSGSWWSVEIWHRVLQVWDFRRTWETERAWWSVEIWHRVLQYKRQIENKESRLVPVFTDGGLTSVYEIRKWLRPARGMTMLENGMPVQGRELSISPAGNPSQNIASTRAPIYWISRLSRLLRLLEEFWQNNDVVVTWAGSSPSPIDHLTRRPTNLVDRG
jgi:hypothetical protein